MKMHAGYLCDPLIPEPYVSRDAIRPERNHKLTIASYAIGILLGVAAMIGGFELVVRFFRG